MKLGQQSQQRQLRLLMAQVADEFETRIRIAAIDNRERDGVAVLGGRGIGQAKLGVDRDLESGTGQQAEKALLRDWMLAEQKCLAAAAMDRGAIIG